VEEKEANRRQGKAPVAVAKEEGGREGANRDKCCTGVDGVNIEPGTVRYSSMYSTVHAWICATRVQALFCLYCRVLAGWLNTQHQYRPASTWWQRRSRIRMLKNSLVGYQSMILQVVEYEY